MRIIEFVSILIPLSGLIFKILKLFHVNKAIPDVREFAILDTEKKLEKFLKNLDTGNIFSASFCYV